MARDMEMVPDFIEITSAVSKIINNFIISQIVSLKLFCELIENVLAVLMRDATTFL